MQLYPTNTKTVITLARLVRPDTARTRSERLSGRMIPAAAHLAAGGFLGWQLAMARGGAAQITLIGSADTDEADLRWMAEQTAIIGKRADVTPPEISLVYTLRLPEGGHRHAAVGFAARETQSAEVLWPQRFSGVFPELCAALRQTGGILRFLAGPAEAGAQADCRADLEKSWRRGDMPMEEYLGAPVRAQMLLALPEAASLRLKTVLRAAIPGAGLEPAKKADWAHPLASAPVLPDIAARILMLEPIADDTRIPGVECCDAPAEPIPMTFDAAAAPNAVTIGTAETTGGEHRSVTLGMTDLRRHWQIIGQTGTGKSTLLAHTICSAIEQGHGLTFFDPHGTTISQVLRMLPEDQAQRVQVLRLGDRRHPIPLSLWSSFDPEREERTINDLASLLMEIFDKQQRGIAGPRWERWFSVFCKAAIAVYGPRANFETIITLSQDSESMRKLIWAVQDRHPDLAQTIRAEYIDNDSRDYADLINWCVSKLQRLTNVAQLRNTLGAGANALDFTKTLDSDTVTLIDLAVPAMGTHAARVLGTILLQKLWIAAQQRRDPARTHLVLLDEAHLFQQVLPSMLAEGRKFGLALVLAHQHCGQLADEVREALEANSASFSAFRLSARDAREALPRLEDERLYTTLCRLDAFRAVTTLSVDGRQSEPFTLQIPKPAPRPEDDAVAAEIERRSRARLSDAYGSLRPLTAEERLQWLERPPEGDSELPHWLREYQNEMEFQNNMEEFLLDEHENIAI